MDNIFEIRRYLTCANSAYKEHCETNLIHLDSVLLYCPMGFDFCKSAAISHIDDVFIANKLPLDGNKLEIAKEHYKKINKVNINAKLAG
jgi:hypothetical protein